MRCPIQADKPEVLLDYCSRKLSPEAELSVGSHLTLCPECMSVVQAQWEVWEVLNGWEPDEVSSDFDERLFARIDDQRRWWRFRTWKPLSIAAACATALLAALLFNPEPAREPAASGTAVTDSSRIETLEPEQLERTLEDMEMLRQLSGSRAL